MERKLNLSLINDTLINHTVVQAGCLPFHLPHHFHCTLRLIMSCHVPWKGYPDPEREQTGSAKANQEALEDRSILQTKIIELAGLTLKTNAARRLFGCVWCMFVVPRYDGAGV